MHVTWIFLQEKLARPSMNREYFMSLFIYTGQMVIKLNFLYVANQIKIKQCIQIRNQYKLLDDWELDEESRRWFCTFRET